MKSDKKKNLDPNLLTEDNTSPEELSAFQRWELPAMDEQIQDDSKSHALSSRPKPKTPVIEEEEEEDIKPLTAEDLEAIRQAGYDDGYESGQKEGHDAGFKAGYQAGDAELKAVMARLSQVTRALMEPIEPQDEALETALLELVQGICGRVIQRELTLDSRHIVTIVKEAIDCLNPGSKRVRIHLNPKDAEIVTEALQENGDKVESWRILAHPTITPGGCIVETDSSLIDVRAEKRLASVIKQVYEKSERGLDAEKDDRSGLDQVLSEIPAFAIDDDATDPIDDVEETQLVDAEENDDDIDVDEEESGNEDSEGKDLP